MAVFIDLRNIILLAKPEYDEINLLSEQFVICPTID